MKQKIFLRIYKNKDQKIIYKITKTIAYTNNILQNIKKTLKLKFL